MPNIPMVSGISVNLAKVSELWGETPQMETYGPGETIYTPGAAARSVYLVMRGSVRLYRLGVGGRRFTVASLRPGAVFGQASLLGTVESETVAEAVERTTLCVVADGAAREVFSKSVDLSLTLLAGMGQRLADVEARLEAMAYKKAPSRLAALLRQMMAEDGSSVNGLTHQTLAEMLGTYRETVSQIIGEFRDRGLLIPGRKRIRVLDQEGLMRVAEQVG